MVLLSKLVVFDNFPVILRWSLKVAVLTIPIVVVGKVTNDICNIEIGISLMLLLHKNQTRLYSAMSMVHFAVLN